MCESRRPEGCFVLNWLVRSYFSVSMRLIHYETSYKPPSVRHKTGVGIAKYKPRLLRLRRVRQTEHRTSLVQPLFPSAGPAQADARPALLAARDEPRPLVRARAYAGWPLQPACRPRVPPRRSDAPTDAAAHPSTLTSAVRAKCAAITERARVWSADVALAHRVLCSFPLSRGGAGPRRLYSASRRALFAGLVARVLRSIRGEACATGDAVHARALPSPPLLAHVACSLTLYSRTRPLSRIPPPAECAPL